MNNLSKGQWKLDRLMTARHGWLRFFGHFVLFCSVFQAAGFICYELGVSPAWLLLASWPLVALGLTMIVILEAKDLLDRKHSFGKALIDLLAKASGLATGLATWLLWYK